MVRRLDAVAFQVWAIFCFMSYAEFQRKFLILQFSVMIWISPVNFLFFFSFFKECMQNSRLPISATYLHSSSEKAMATHSSTLAWKIPWTEEPSRLQSMGSLIATRLSDWATSLSLFTFMHWRRQWQPTPVFLPGESQGLGSLEGCCLWGRTELDMTEVT